MTTTSKKQKWFLSNHFFRNNKYCEVGIYSTLSLCHPNLNNRMKDNIAALAQTMSLFDQRKDDASQPEDGQYNEEDDNESYEELGFLAINVAGGDSGESNRVERRQKNAWYAKSAYGGLYIDSSDDGKKGALLLAIMHAISYHLKSRLWLL